MSEPIWSEFEVHCYNDETVYVEHRQCGRTLDEIQCDESRRLERPPLDLELCINWARAHNCPERRHE